MTHESRKTCSFAPARGAGCETRPTTSRLGYTLFELIVVVTLIVLIGTLTLPSLTGVFADARLDASADMIRARMADARSMAMAQGRTFRFGFLPGSGKFQIAADDSPLWDAVDTSGPAESDDHLRGELLQDVIFGTDANAFAGVGTPNPGGAWQVGGIFISDGTGRASVNPDGTTVDDVTFFFGKAGFSPMAVQFRGLTGAVRIFDPTAEGEQP
jgi:Tfp pilus assembly protein FimT